MIASTARYLDTVDDHRMSARVDLRDGSYETDEMAIPGIIDRVGTGDAFAAGILHALAIGLAPLEIARNGLALCALKHFIPGDMTTIDRRTFDAFLTGGMDARR